MWRPVEQLQLLEAGAGPLDEPLLRKAAWSAREVRGQPPDQGREKNVLRENVLVLSATRRRHASKPAAIP
jgi:hypothetical protein